MSAIAFSSLDTAELTKDLPSLICETDIEQQAINIKNWLTPIVPVKAVGLSISGCSQGKSYRYGHHIDQAVIDEIERLMRKTDNDSRDTVNEDMMIFALNGQGPEILKPMDSRVASPFNGLALRLKYHDDQFGVFFLVADADLVINFDSDEVKLKWLASVLSNLFYNACSHHQNQETLRLFKLYKKVSSLICCTGDLQELLTMIISIIVSELPSEEGSILLLDEESNEFEFFSAIGETGAGLVQCRFPADRGIAGKAFRDGVPVVVNDVQTCPYFFKDFDDKSGFVTRSILSAPIIACDEKIGVIEAINKVGRHCFNEEDKNILKAIADEVGLAVKNARIFDYVVNSYCKLRQGHNNCDGCERPLKSWTPCIKGLVLSDTGPGISAPYYLKAPIKMITAARDLIAAGDFKGACDHLKAAYRTCVAPCHSDPVEDDMRERLTALALNLMTDIGCQ